MKKFICIAILIFCAVSLYAEESPAGDSRSKWHQWITGQQDYLDKIESLMKETKDMVIQQNADLRAAMANKDKESGEKIVAETTTKLSSVVERLKALNPPEEFKEYHAKVVEAYDCRRLTNDATVQKDVGNIKTYSRMAMTYELEAMQILRMLYASHNAPTQLIESIDRGITSYKQRLAL